ncbi:hypothetical protein RFI_12089 [Reticulomyxa filosa]|uniref:Uncharacterized protein n=1 Tax=Reticulomyxa filosa TaxID=46433 RepID=X6NFG0_RETFI|nr:hypothetical protein RFI_12089 [Reticulomyxa filosa]|eukprot:ETO25055.1 hypothetical protein RFI_12089 [Reticulomyxa filosa]
MNCTSYRSCLFKTYCCHNTRICHLLDKSVRYDSEDPGVYHTNIRLFESQLAQKEVSPVLHMEFEHKKWLYAIFYKECQNFIPNEVLKAFTMTVVMSFFSIRNWSEELLDILPFLRALEETALSLEGEDSNRNYGIALHTIVLSLVMSLVQHMRPSRYQQELWSRCQEIRSYRQAHGQMLAIFSLDNLGRIELEGYFLFIYFFCER